MVFKICVFLINNDTEKLEYTAFILQLLNPMQYLFIVSEYWVYMHMLKCVWAATYVCTGAYVCPGDKHTGLSVDIRGCYQPSSSIALHLICLRHDLSLNLEFLSLVSLAGQPAPGVLCLCLPSAKIISTVWCTCLCHYRW